MNPAFSTTTSGDYLADRRYDYADAALAAGDFIAARDLFEQVIERAPQWPPAQVALAKACLGLGDAVAARHALETALAQDPQDRLGAGLLLAQLGGAASTGAMPDAFVAALFDEYAPRFDQHLTGVLAYRAPALLAALLARHPGAGPRTVLDLGCGTGLMARALPGGAMPPAWHGVDLSGAMLAKAEATGLYASLARAGLLPWLQARATQSAELVIAADVFCYVPDLAPVFAEVARVLTPQGRFAFSVQTHKGAGVVIGADQRVHHAPALIRALGLDAGLVLLAEDPASTRRDRGVDVPGALYLFGAGA